MCTGKKVRKMMFRCALVPAMQFADACVVGGGVAVLAVYIGTFTFSECITQLLTSRTVYKVSDVTVVHAHPEKQVVWDCYGLQLPATQTHVLCNGSNRVWDVQLC